MDITLVGLIVMALVATVSSWFICRPKQFEKPVKILLFGLYFWLIVFIQLMVFAILYYFGLVDLK